MSLHCGGKINAVSGHDHVVIDLHGSDQLLCTGFRVADVEFSGRSMEKIKGTLTLPS